jgi:hypothetical protein
MVRLRQDSRGNFIARKRLPDALREEYGQLYGARVEAKFFARASLGKQIAQQRFHQWATEVEQRSASLRWAPLFAVWWENGTAGSFRPRT